MNTRWVRLIHKGSEDRFRFKIGDLVISTRDSTLKGRIVDGVFDPTRGRIVYAIRGPGGVHFMGLEEELVSIFSLTPS